METPVRLRCETGMPGAFRGGPVPCRLDAEADGGLVLRPAGAGDASHQVVSLLGRPFVTHLPAADEVISRELGESGYWEFAESALLLSLVRPGMTVLDVGANL